MLNIILPAVVPFSRTSSALLVLEADAPPTEADVAHRKRSHAVILSDFVSWAAEVIHNPTPALQGHETNQTKERAAHSQTS